MLSISRTSGTFRFLGLLLDYYSHFWQNLYFRDHSYFLIILTLYTAGLKKTFVSSCQFENYFFCRRISNSTSLRGNVRHRRRLPTPRHRLLHRQHRGATAALLVLHDIGVDHAPRGGPRSQGLHHTPATEIQRAEEIDQ